MDFVGSLLEEPELVFGFDVTTPDHCSDGLRALTTRLPQAFSEMILKLTIERGTNLGVETAQPLKSITLQHSESPYVSPFEGSRSRHFQHFTKRCSRNDTLRRTADDRTPLAQSLGLSGSTLFHRQRLSSQTSRLDRATDDISAFSSD